MEAGDGPKDVGREETPPGAQIAKEYEEESTRLVQEGKLTPEFQQKTQARINDLITRLDRETGESAAQTARADAMEKDKMEHIKRADILQAELEQKMEKLEREKKEAMEAKREAEMKYRVMEKDKEATERLVEEGRENIMEQKAEVDRLTQELAFERKNSENLVKSLQREEKARLENKIQMEGNLKRAAEDAESFREKYDETKKTLDAITARLDKAQRKAKEQDDEIEELNDEIKVRDEKIHALQMRCDSPPHTESSGRSIQDELDAFGSVDDDSDDDEPPTPEEKANRRKSRVLSDVVDPGEYRRKLDSAIIELQAEKDKYKQLETKIESDYIPLPKHKEEVANYKSKLESYETQLATHSQLIEGKQKELRDVISDRDEKVTSHARSIADKARELDTLKADRDKLLAEKAKVEKDHAAALKKLQGQVDVLQKEVESLKSDKTASDKTLKKLQDERDQLVAGKTKAESDHAAVVKELQDRIRALQKEITPLTSDKTAYDKALKELQEEVRKRGEENDASRKKDADTIKGLEDQLVAMEAKKTKAEKNATACEAELKELRSKLADKTDKDDKSKGAEQAKIQELEKQNAELKDQLKRLDKDKENAEKVLKALQGEVAKQKLGDTQVRNKDSDKIQTLERQIKVLEAQRKRLEDDMTASKESKDEVAKESTKERATSDIDVARAQELEEQVRVLEGHKTRLESEKSTCEATLERVKADTAKEKSKDEESKKKDAAKIRELQDKQKHLDQDLKKAQARINHLQNIELELRTTGRLTKAEASKRGVANKSEDTAEFEVQRKQLEDKIGHLEASLASPTVAQRQEPNQALADEVANLKTELDKCKEENKQLKKEAHDLLMERAGEEAGSQNQDAELDKANKALEASQTERNRLEVEVECLQALIDRNAEHAAKTQAALSQQIAVFEESFRSMQQLIQRAEEKAAKGGEVNSGPINAAREQNKKQGKLIEDLTYHRDLLQDIVDASTATQRPARDRRIEAGPKTGDTSADASQFDSAIPHAHGGLWPGLRRYLRYTGGIVLRTGTHVGVLSVFVSVFIVLIAAIIAEGAQHAEWRRANAHARALWMEVEEEGTFVCLSPPKFDYFWHCLFLILSGRWPF